MPDKTKVIKGLYEHGYHDCKKCPYWGTGRGGSSECRQLAKDALNLLKEQEAIIEQYHKADGFLAVHGWKWKERCCADGERETIRKPVSTSATDYDGINCE